jgi:hypothetical protein
MHYVAQLILHCSAYTMLLDLYYIAWHVLLLSNAWSFADARQFGVLMVLPQICSVNLVHLMCVECDRDADRFEDVCGLIWALDLYPRCI